VTILPLLNATSKVVSESWIIVTVPVVAVTLNNFVLPEKMFLLSVYVPAAFIRTAPVGVVLLVKLDPVMVCPIDQSNAATLSVDPVKVQAVNGTVDAELIRLQALKITLEMVELVGNVLVPRFTQLPPSQTKGALVDPVLEKTHLVALVTVARLNVQLSLALLFSLIPNASAVSMTVLGLSVKLLLTLAKTIVSSWTSRWV
jgi:hypothetical protein